MKPIIYTILFLSITVSTFATQWNVGTGLTYTKPSGVSSLVQDGDTVNIQAGLYSGDVAHWTRNNLLLRGVGGMAHLAAAGQAYGDKGIWVIGGSNTTIEHIEFSDCAISQANGSNGAGIRQEGTSLTIRHCYFHDNQNGILTNADAASNILIEYTEFKHNGAGDGFSHNMYIGNINSFTLRYCYTHLTTVGHNVKTRANRNFIMYNRIMDEIQGDASYQIDVPNGGETYIIGNIIQKGGLAQNSTMVTYGEEGYANALKQLLVVNNTMVNEKASGSTFIRVATGADTVAVVNNLYLGPGTFFNYSGSALLGGNLLGDTSFVMDTATYNYRLKAGSPAIDAGIATPAYNSNSLVPAYQYLDTDNAQARSTQGNAIDVGAYEFGSSTGINMVSIDPELVLYPNPSNGLFNLAASGFSSNETVIVTVCNSIGQIVSQTNSYPTQGHIATQLNLQSLSQGIYLVRISQGDWQVTKLVQIEK